MAAVARGLLDAAERLRGAVAGKELAELAGRAELVEMLLGGMDPGAEDPYVKGSLARLYRDLYGVGVAAPRRLAARLRDGLPLRLAGRGVVVEAHETRFLRLVSGLAEAAGGLAEALGARVEPLVFDTGDPLWGLEAARRLAEEALASLPPYSREAMALFAAGAPAPLGVAARLLGSAEAAGELEGLGYRVVLELPGAEEEGEQGLFRRLGVAAEGSPLALYRCLALLAARLLQLEELRLYIEAPDPVAAMAAEAAGQGGGLLEELRSAASGGPEARLPLPAGCRGEAPGLPTGLAVYSGRLVLRDVEVYAGEELLGTYMELLGGLSGLLYRGLAGLRPVGEGDGGWVVEWWAVMQRRP